MRLYRLGSRVGKKTTSLLPWPADPLAVSPEEFAGWRWDNELFAWEQTQAPTVVVIAPPIIYPTPLEAPRLADPVRVPGWQWSDSMQDWVETPMPPVRVQREMDRPPAPTESPRPAVPYRVPGWQWSDSMQDWVETPMGTVRVPVTPDRPPAPTESPRPAIAESYRCWSWSSVRLQWRYVGLTDMQIARGIVCDSKPSYSPGPEIPSSVDGWVWSVRYVRWLAVSMPTEWVDFDIQRPPSPGYPPGPHVPSEVEGWTWSSARRKWIEQSMPLEWVDVEGVRPAKPTVAPRVAYPDRVLGWSWDYETGQWLEVIYAEAVTEFEMPGPPPPNINFSDPQQAAIYDVDIGAVVEALRQDIEGGAFPMRVHVDNMLRMLEKSGYSPAAARAVMAEYQKLTVGATAAQKTEVFRRATDAFYRIWQQSHKLSSTHAQELWARGVKDEMQRSLRTAGPAGQPIVLYALAILTGIIAGLALENVTRGTSEDVSMSPAIGEYLMGPGSWSYAGVVSVSESEVAYYKSCGGIGASNAHHLRGSPFGSDVIAFTPAGFLQTGYKFPRWLKYRWEYWSISYVGFLVRVGDNLYRLQDGSKDPQQTGFARIYPADEVCPDFEYYL